MFLLLLGLAGSAAAQTPIEQPEQSFVTSVRKGGSLGVGLGIGAPTGLSARLWFGDWSALQVGLGGNLGVNRSVVATADYLVTLKNISGPGGEYILPIYIGAGLKADVDMASSDGSIVVFSKALDWPGMLGTSRGTLVIGTLVIGATSLVLGHWY